MTTETDAEIISEEKLPERPKEVRSVSLPMSAAKTANAVATGLDTIGATAAANKVRAGMAAAQGAVQAVESLKPVVEQIKEFAQDLKDKGYLKMAPRRRAFSPRKKAVK